MTSENEKQFSVTRAASKTGGAAKKQIPISTGFFALNSDWLPNLSAERLEIVKRIMPAHGVTARPVDYFDHRFMTTWIVTDTRQSVRRDVIGVFNFHDAEMQVCR